MRSELLMRARTRVLCSRPSGFLKAAAFCQDPRFAGFGEIGARARSRVSLAVFVSPGETSESLTLRRGDSKREGAASPHVVFHCGSPTVCISVWRLPPDPYVNPLVWPAVRFPALYVI